METIKLFMLIAAVASLMFSLLFKSGNELSNEIISASSDAIQLSLTLAGAMAFWGGVMRIAEKSGLVLKISKLFRPLLCVLFRGIDENGEAFGAIVMNLTANLMGLGNAATPLGIKAVQALKKEQKAGSRATSAMIMLVVLNTASLQLIPTTVAALRQAHGSNAPMDIILPVWVTAICSVTVGVLLTKIFEKGQGK